MAKDDDRNVELIVNIPMPLFMTMYDQAIQADIEISDLIVQDLERMYLYPLQSLQQMNDALGIMIERLQGILGVGDDLAPIQVVTANH